MVKRIASLIHKCGFVNIAILIVISVLFSHTPLLAQEKGIIEGTFSDDGVWLFYALAAESETIMTADSIAEQAQMAGLFAFLGDSEEGVLAIEPGVSKEEPGSSHIDEMPEEVAVGLWLIDDFGVLNSGRVDDDRANLDMGTGGQAVVALRQPTLVIVPDGVVATGALQAALSDTPTAAEIDAGLGGFEILIYEDADLSGMIIELIAPNQTYTITIADRQSAPDMPENRVNDTLIAIDLDTLPSFDDDYIEAIRVTDDGQVIEDESIFAGETSVEVDAIVTRKQVAVATAQSSLGGRVWRDEDGDGKPDTKPDGTIDLDQFRTALPDVGVQLSGITVKGDTLLLTQTTGADGRYLFSDLAAGTYTVTVLTDTLPAEMRPTADPDGIETAHTTQVTLRFADYNAEQNFGYAPIEPTATPTPIATNIPPVTAEPTATPTLIATDVPPVTAEPTITVTPTVETSPMRDIIWNDVDGDGVREAREPGVSDVRVRLADKSGVVGTTKSDDKGIYHFEDVATGVYTLTVELPAQYTDYVFSPQTMTEDDSGNDADKHGIVPAFTFVAGQEDAAPNIGIVLPPASIAGLIWLDEDGDELYSISEPGISNISIQLLEEMLEENIVIATTKTDIDGRYIFNDVLPGTYYVRIDETTLPITLLEQSKQRRTAGHVKQAAESIEVVVEAGGEYTVSGISFGYGNPNGNDGNGAIGDRVWLDADGNGIQDIGEAGLEGVLVTLFADLDNDGLILNSEIMSTTTTLPDGTFIFTDLPTGIYRLAVDTTAGSPLNGYTQTGDPDYIGFPPIRTDDQTTEPVVLAPGDVYLNADFGYLPPIINSLGNLVYIDTNANGQFDGLDAGIPAVTLSLIDSNQNIIATTRTDATGQYLFPGVLDDTYQLIVSDTDNVLGALVQNGDPDGVLDEQTTITLAGGQSDMTLDFGYIPSGHTGSHGLLGDIVFLDADGDGTADLDEGIEGITVQLLDQSGNFLQSTATNENGSYYFGRLDPGTYSTSIVAASVPTGLVINVDPDGTADAVTTITVGNGSSLINLDQDFGYVVDPNGTIGRIGGDIWEDGNANGLFDDTGDMFDGVTVALYFDVNGNGLIDLNDPILRTATTDAIGHFTFADLPADNVSYIVVITDQARKLSGYWHSIGPIPGADGNSQALPYPVTLTPGQPLNDSADFGYYIRLAAIGNRIWFDKNQNGIQDSDEQTGFTNTMINLTVSYPNNDSIVMSESGDDGEYAFRNLLADEDFNGTGETPPTYMLSLSFANVSAPTLINIGANDLVDSDDYLGEQAFPIQGESNVVLLSDPAAEPPEASYDFGFIDNPNPDAPNSAVHTEQVAVRTSHMPILTLLVVLFLGTATMFRFGR